MHMPVNTAVRAVVRSPGKAAPLVVLCLRVGAFTFFFFSSQVEVLTRAESESVGEMIAFSNGARAGSSPAAATKGMLGSP